METCDLCNPNLQPLIATKPYWRLILNHNQNLLGKCFWVLQRHEEQVSGLTGSEWVALHSHIQATVLAARRLWRPDHFNIVFLQNQDRHVHLHIIPRYVSERQIGNRIFDDLDYPSHYAVAGPSLGLPQDYESPHDKLPLSSEEFVDLADSLRQAYKAARQ